MGYFLHRQMSDEAYYLALARRPRQPGAFSKFRGVVKSTSKHPYRAQLTYQGKRHYLGVFTSEIEAARAYNRAALEIIGPHAVLNDLDA